MVTQTATEFPYFEKRLETLVETHKALEDEPLALAVYYAPPREVGDIFLFEVIDRFGDNAVGPDSDFFEVTYASTPGFPMGEDQKLHLILTNPVELKYALDQKWNLAVEICEAFKNNKANVLYVDPKYNSLLETLHG